MDSTYLKDYETLVATLVKADKREHVQLGTKFSRQCKEVTITEIHSPAREVVLLKLFERLMKDTGLIIMQTYDSVLGYQYTLTYRSSTTTENK